LEGKADEGCRRGKWWEWDWGEKRRTGAKGKKMRN